MKVELDPAVHKTLAELVKALTALTLAVKAK
jgi:hypothetical protein